MNEKTVAIVILNYNSAQQTENLIQSLKKFEEDYDLIIVDNHSSKSDREQLEKFQTCAEIMELRQNSGYAAGNNAGIKRAMELKYQYILIANSDIEIIYPNTIKKLVFYMDKLHADAVGPQMRNDKGEINSGIIIDNRMGRTSRKITHEITPCRSLVGACLLLSRRMIEKNGYIPEEYFLYREETDYLIQAYQKDLKIYYIPQIEIIHRHGTTTGKVWDYYFNRNSIYFARKIWHTPVIFLALFHFLKSVYLTYSIFTGLEHRENKAESIKLMWLGYVDGIHGKIGKKENM